MVEENFKYGKPIAKPPKGGKRLPQYDECLREYLSSKSNYWEVNLDALPSQKIMIILSSLRWRVKTNPSEYGNVRVIMRDKKIYLGKVKA